MENLRLPRHLEAVETISYNQMSGILVGIFSISLYENMKRWLTWAQLIYNLQIGFASSLYL